MADKKTIPTWKENFPISQSDEHKMSRREFTKMLGMGAMACAGFTAVQQFLPVTASAAPMAVADVGELAVGEYKLFNYPTPDHPALLIHLEQNEYVAYSQSCTHLMCPVHYEAETQQLVCPCHAGFFNAKNGEVIAGPPPRPLPNYPISIQDGKIFVGKSTTAVA